MNSTVQASHVTKHLERTNIPKDAESNPHHVLKNNRTVGFRNPYPSYADPAFFTKVVWPKLTGRLKNPDLNAAQVPIVKPQWLPSRHASDALRTTWLGHACHYVEFPSGLRVLFDPVFEENCSPWFMKPFGPNRFTERPCDVKDLPAVDAICISHSHYDHLSSPTLLELKKYHPHAQYFVGLGLEKWFRDMGFDNVTELDWWEDAELTVKVRDEEKHDNTITAKISCLPSQHNSARTPFDKDRTLWASWAVYSGEKSVWFGGDTGYRAVPEVAEGIDDWGEEFAHLPTNPQFKDIGRLRGPFDVGLIPIGAYAPRAAFSGVHANPYDAVEIFVDTRCKKALGIHWGTWALTTEEVMEPPRLLKAALRRKGLPEEGVFDICDIGESSEFPLRASLAGEASN